MSMKQLLPDSSSSSISLIFENPVDHLMKFHANCWLFMRYLCVLPSQPHSLCSSRCKIPLFALTGITPDISIILLFTFYQPVFYATHDQHFPSESEERAAYWVGFGEHCGDAMTHKLLDHETHKTIYGSAVRPQKSSTLNHRLAPHGGRFPIF